MKTFLRHIATLGPVGHIPGAPGTYGTLVALFIFAFWTPSGIGAAIIFLASLVAGTAAAGEAERSFNEKDSGRIVIDEFAGYAASVVFLPPALPYYIAAFFLFRFFDILKPPPIRNIERLFSGGKGVMADDVAAGVLVNAILQTWRLLI